MIVQMYTETDRGEEVWIDAYLDENKIVCGYPIPAYIDPDIPNLIIYTDELNLFVGGGQITVKSTALLLVILKERFA